MASAGKPTDAQWQVRGNHAEGHSDIANTRLLHAVEHGEDILSFESFDNDFLSVEKKTAAISSSLLHLGFLMIRKKMPRAVTVTMVVELTSRSKTR